jgi:hypothetical protein
LSCRAALQELRDEAVTKFSTFLAAIQTTTRQITGSEVSIPKVYAEIPFTALQYVTIHLPLDTICRPPKEFEDISRHIIMPLLFLRLESLTLLYQSKGQGKLNILIHEDDSSELTASDCADSLCTYMLFRMGSIMRQILSDVVGVQQLYSEFSNIRHGRRFSEPVQAKSVILKWNLGVETSAASLKMLEYISYTDDRKRQLLTRLNSLPDSYEWPLEVRRWSEDGRRGCYRVFSERGFHFLGHNWLDDLWDESMFDHMSDEVRFVEAT